jgi:hypothetical protein
VASSGRRRADFDAAIILPPRIRYLADFQQAYAHPRFSTELYRLQQTSRPAETVAEVKRLVEVAGCGHPPHCPLTCSHNTSNAAFCAQ